MRLFHWQSPSGNFGDDLNLWYWDRFLDGWRSWDEDCTLIGVGSILNTRILPESARYLVLGSGSGFGELPDVSDGSRWDVRFVRGPMTARNLGLDAEAYATDPAALIARLPDVASTERSGTAFIPHCHSDASPFYDWPRICEAAGLTHVSPRADSAAVIRAIGRAERVISESMHGAIMADALRIPWLPVAQLDRFNHFKWQDWAASLELEISIAPLPAVRTTRPKLEGYRSWGLYRALTGKKQKMIPHEPSPEEIEATQKALAASLTRLGRERFYLSDARVLADRLDRIEAIFEATSVAYSRGGRG
jgi:succinoglycan biosynthesis protein ExoV